MFQQDTRLHYMQITSMLFMSLLSIQLIFSLPSLFVFSLFLFICRCSLALSRLPQVSHLKNSTTTPALESASLYFILSLSCHFIPYCIMIPLCRLSVEHVYLFYVLTMGVFTTSWWVVNQPIVMVIFPYAFYILMLVYIRPFEA